MAFTRELYKLGFEISPVILCDGVAQSIPGGMLPIVALTQSASYVSNLLGGAANLTDTDKYSLPLARRAGRKHGGLRYRPLSLR